VADIEMPPIKRIIALTQHADIKPATNPFLKMSVVQILGIFIGVVVVIAVLISLAIWCQCYYEVRKQKLRATRDEENGLRDLPGKGTRAQNGEKVESIPLTQRVPGAYQMLRGGVMRPVPVEETKTNNAKMPTIVEEEED
jgi:hypothetical protein